MELKLAAGGLRMAAGERKGKTRPSMMRGRSAISTRARHAEAWRHARYLPKLTGPTHIIQETTIRIPLIYPHTRHVCSLSSKENWIPPPPALALCLHQHAPPSYVQNARVASGLELVLVLVRDRLDIVRLRALRARMQPGSVSRQPGRHAREG